MGFSGRWSTDGVPLNESTVSKRTILSCSKYSLAKDSLLRRGTARPFSTSEGEKGFPRKHSLAKTSPLVFFYLRSVVVQKATFCGVGPRGLCPRATERRGSHDDLPCFFRDSLLSFSLFFPFSLARLSPLTAGSGTVHFPCWPPLLCARAKSVLEMG